ncbi:hypothetical protein [Sinobaca sp. H24]|uniref:hypothetical protein n=1 Tax=Sinobaca sp. H24 TaxID=2923376 RepID=UPI0027E2E5C0|nr:hypothetical protein [Sinobaca sp. H24]
MKKFTSAFMTPFRMIIFSYIVSMLIFSVLLWLPVSHNPGVELGYLDSLFTSVSAVSVTGLTVINVRKR